MKERASHSFGRGLAVARYLVILGGALVALVAGLAASALSRLRGAEGSSILGDLLGGRSGSLLTQLAFWTAVVALLVVIATALICLAREASRARGVRRRPVPSVPEVERTPPRERRPLPDNRRWLRLAEGCVEIIDELDQNADGFDPPRRELAEHVALRLEETLERSGVEVIKGEVNFDGTRHRSVPGGAEPPTGATISETLNPGFAVGPQVLLRARVRVEGRARDANW
jgi:hypothetical protein